MGHPRFAHFPKPGKCGLPIVGRCGRAEFRRGGDSQCERSGGGSAIKPIRNCCCAEETLAMDCRGSGGTDCDSHWRRVVLPPSSKQAADGQRLPFASHFFKSVDTKSKQFRERYENHRSVVRAVEVVK